MLLIIVILIIAIPTYGMWRRATDRYIDRMLSVEEHVSGIDQMDGIEAGISLCPLSHRANCTCTWR
jgi:hypothetical protein